MFSPHEAVVRHWSTHCEPKYISSHIAASRLAWFFLLNPSLFVSAAWVDRRYVLNFFTDEKKFYKKKPVRIVCTYGSDG